MPSAPANGPPTFLRPFLGIEKYQFYYDTPLQPAERHHSYYERSLQLA